MDGNDRNYPMKILAFLCAALVLWLIAWAVIDYRVAFPILLIGLAAMGLRKRFALAEAIYRYCRAIWTGIDQLVNAASGGHPDETISSRAGRSLERAILAGRKPAFLTLWIVKWANLFDEGHAAHSIEESAQVREQRDG